MFYAVGRIYLDEAAALLAALDARRFAYFERHGRRWERIEIPRPIRRIHDHKVEGE